MRPPPPRRGESGTVIADLDVPSSRGVVGDVRRRLTDAATGAGVDTDTTDTLVLLASELVTNAVLHGNGRVHVRAVTTSRGTVVLEVSDGRPGQVVPREMDLWSTGGRGLAMVDVMAWQWGCRSDMAGKVVWCETAPSSLT